jgi:hypothetical protein
MVAIAEPRAKTQDQAAASGPFVAVFDLDIIPPTVGDEATLRAVVEIRGAKASVEEVRAAIGTIDETLLQHRDLIASGAANAQHFGRIHRLIEARGVYSQRLAKLKRLAGDKTTEPSSPVGPDAIEAIRPIHEYGLGNFHPTLNAEEARVRARLATIERDARTFRELVANQQWYSGEAATIRRSAGERHAEIGYRLREINAERAILTQESMAGKAVKPRRYLIAQDRVIEDLAAMADARRESAARLAQVEGDRTAAIGLQSEKTTRAIDQAGGAERVAKAVIAVERLSGNLPSPLWEVQGRVLELSRTIAKTNESLAKIDSGPDVEEAGIVGILSRRLEETTVALASASNELAELHRQHAAGLLTAALAGDERARSYLAGLAAQWPEAFGGNFLAAIQAAQYEVAVVLELMGQSPK